MIVSHVTLCCTSIYRMFSLILIYYHLDFLLNCRLLCVVAGRVTYSGPSTGLQAYAAKIYSQAQMGQPPVANAPEVRERSGGREGGYD